jgi:glycosyltransferase involved in cell wall biosynthesis
MIDPSVAPAPSSGDRPPARVRVMHLIPRYRNDGTCRMVNALVKYADHSRFEIFVGILSRDEGSLQSLVDMGAKPVQFDMKRFTDVSVIPALIRTLRDNRIQILHTHRTRPDLLGRIAGRWAGVPVNVSTMHWVGEWSWRGKALARPVRLLYRLTLPLTQKIVNISAGEMALMQAEGISADKMTVIYNGVDGEVFLPAKPRRDELCAPDKESPLVVGCVAFLSKRKGVHHLIDAFRQVVDRCPHARLQIAGDGEERAALQAQIMALELQRHVELLGTRQDVPQLMNAFDIVVLPSLWEPFGLAIVEAMACAKPVVATRVGGIPEIVEHGRTGLLVPPATAAPLAEALLSLIENAALRTRLGEAGRQRFVERFDSRTMAANYEALYDSLL